MTRVRDVFGLDLSEAVVFRKPTIAALVGEIGQQLACRLVEGGWRLVRGKSGTAEGGRDRAVLRRRPRAAPLPLSYAQQRLWFLDRVDPGPAYHMAIALRLTGLLDRAVLAAALGRIRDRHEVLRTTFPVVGGEPVQNVGAPGLVPVPLRELNVPQPAEPAAVEQALLEEFERPFDLATGPLLRAAIVSTGPRDHRLLVTVHHIVFDGWSTAIFLRELSGTCRVLAGGWTTLLDLFRFRYSTRTTRPGSVSGVVVRNLKRSWTTGGGSFVRLRFSAPSRRIGRVRRSRPTVAPACIGGSLRRSLPHCAPSDIATRPPST